MVRMESGAGTGSENQSRELVVGAVKRVKLNIAGRTLLEGDVGTAEKAEQKRQSWAPEKN